MRWSLESRLIVDTVKGVVSPKIQLEAPAIATDLQRIGLGARRRQIECARPDRGKATPTREGHRAREYGEAGIALKHLACRLATHHAVVDGGPVGHRVG